MDHVVSRPPLAIALALAASASYAFAAVLQHRAARRESKGSMVSAKLLVTLFQRKLWLAGTAVGALGIGFQTIASHFGSLTLVQCLLVGNLVFVVPIAAVVEKRKINRIDALGVLLAGAGLTLFLVLTQPTEGNSEISGARAGRVGLYIAAAVAVCLIAARRAGGDRRAALLGTSAGIVVGTLDALIKSSSDLGAQGIKPLFVNWPIYAFAGVGILVLLLEQNALATGRLPSAQSGISVLEPVTGILLGVLAFHESLDTGWSLIGEVVAAGIALAGIIVLSSTNSRWQQQPLEETDASDPSPALGRT